MTLNEFVTAIKVAFPVGTVIDNPGGGTSTIAAYNETKISYVRGESTISVPFSDLHEAYSHFKGQNVSSVELRAYRPSVFDSDARPAGHSCNCTFLFRVLEKLNLSGPITGSGVRGNPFAVAISCGDPLPKYARILSDRVNRVIVQVPGRSFPGAVLQGDQLFQLVEMAKYSSNQGLYRELLDIYNDLSSVPDKSTKIQITEIIRDKFKQTGGSASIPKQKRGSFTATIEKNGINVDNLGAQPFLPWMVFEEAVWVMRLNGGRAQFGKAMSARLGEPDLPYDSIEGHIASQVYGKLHGDSVFRRIELAPEKKTGV